MTRRAEYLVVTASRQFGIILPKETVSLRFTQLAFMIAQAFVQPATPNPAGS
jgi:hypothetical protein